MVSVKSDTVKLMKRLGKFWLAAVLAVLVFPLINRSAGAQGAQDFVIRNFTADYYLDRNTARTATLRTVESITAEFPSFDQNRGILRALPQSYEGHSVSLKINSVTDEFGVPISYTTSEQNDNLVLKIGDPEKYVRGLKTYKITYASKNVAAIFADHDEFYWDVNGDQWQQPFNEITARVHVSAALAPRLQARLACYFGASGYNDPLRCTTSGPINENGGRLISFEAKGGAAGETMTFVTAFEPGTFAPGPEIAQEKRVKQLKYAGIAGAVALPPLLVSGYLYSRWRKYGRDPKGRGVIIPEYQPPKGLNALSSDFVFQEKLDNKAISALIVELAVRKYLNIYELKQAKRLQKDTITYKLKLIQDPAALADNEKAVVDMFFDKNAKVGAEADLSELKNKLKDDVKSLKKLLGKDLLAKGYFRSDPTTASLRYYTIGLLLAIVGFLFVLWVYAPAGISLGLSGLIFLLFSRFMPSRSQAGVAVREHMLGLRDYMKLAEADRLKFLQSPQGAEKIEAAGLKPDDAHFKVKLFESLLPYAMLFNLEKNWAKQFEDVYKTPPDWYSGNWAAFNAVYLASSLSGFNSASAVTFTSAGSSGSSGFGGGFSGGGGGGGGGGGW